jgi:hypothetical protein
MANCIAAAQLRWAEELGLNDAASLLQETLDEEKATDEALTQIAESVVNQEAEAAWCCAYPLGPYSTNGVVIGANRRNQLRIEQSTVISRHFTRLNARRQDLVSGDEIARFNEVNDPESDLVWLDYPPTWWPKADRSTYPRRLRH